MLHTFTVINSSWMCNTKVGHSRSDPQKCN